MDKIDLPILRYKDQIIQAVRDRHVVIIKAETGAGKSTQVPQFLLACASRVVITQPRRIAAISLAERVAQELNYELGHEVGYRTSLDRKDSQETRLLFCTDGLVLLHHILGKETPVGILVIDEVHEWNMNIELLIAWVRFQLRRGVSYRVVIMSATVDAESLAGFFGDAAIIKVPGRSYPVTEVQPRNTLTEDTIQFLRERHNVLVFQPGKAEIKRIVSDLRGMSIDAEIFPLHAEMSAIDQMPCFLSYPRPKCVVATNVAQTSVTIPDIDAVMDSGLERRVECVDGIEGLYLRRISLADREQRKGRAGRTKAGVYVDFCPTVHGNRDKFPKADVMRLPLDKIILQLALIDVEVEEVIFFHQPNASQFSSARKMLCSIDCIDESGKITATGKKVVRLPTAPRFGRMIVEAHERNVLTEVTTIVAIIEQGGIITRNSEGWKDSVMAFPWSDAFTQLAAYEAALAMPKDTLTEHGIDEQAFFEAWNTRHRLYAAFPQEWKITRSTGRHADIVRAIYTGLCDRIYKRSLVVGYKDSSGNCRELPANSVVADAEFVVGIPWNLQIKTRMGPKTKRIITMATRVDKYS